MYMISPTHVIAQTTALLPANPVSDWFNDAANMFIDSLSNMRIEILKLLAKTALPTVEEMQSKWYSLALGGGYGLASKLVMLVLLITAFVMVITPWSNHSIRLRRTATSFIGVSLFGVLFFPVYSLLYAGVQAAIQGMINVATDSKASSLNDAMTAILSVAMPFDVVFKFIVSLIGAGLSLIALVDSVTIHFAVLAIATCYPLVIALRPISEKFDLLFHAANSAAITTIVSPIVIIGGLLLPTFVANSGSGLGDTGIGAGIATVIGAGIASAGPIIVAIFAFMGSSRVFGKLDFASVNGSVDVDSMPPVSSRDMDASVKNSGFKAFMSSVIPGAATAGLPSSDNLAGDLKSLTIEGASAAAAATGHPWVGGALNAVDTTLSKEKRAHSAEQQSATPAQQPLPSPAPVPVAEQAPVLPSAITDWPEGR